MKMGLQRFAGIGSRIIPSFSEREISDYLGLGVLLDGAFAALHVTLAQILHAAPKAQWWTGLLTGREYNGVI